MNIAEAKQHVKDTVEVYLAQDGNGLNLIDPSRQRPLFLVGAPGIGKTAIMAQVADELGVGLVSYSMTHHTRQSALGLPFIVHHDYKGYEYDSSEYTMSEIVSSIYDYMEETGLERGILFLDEINCVSETLYPSMLQFLQFKTFGRHRIPKGWVVTCAGNPPEYNKSVHEFDIVTLDRLRKLVVEPDYPTWRAYALSHNVHPAVLAFLETKRDFFYSVESSVTGKRFVTARAWDDLSLTISSFEASGKDVTPTLIEQFLQDEEIAESFALYYELFKKYQSDYQVAEILAGTYGAAILERAQAAAFDERLALLGMLLDTLRTDASDILLTEGALGDLRDALRAIKEPMTEGGSAAELLGPLSSDLARRIAEMSASQVAPQGKMRAALIRQDALASMARACTQADTLKGPDAFVTVHQEFRGLVGELEGRIRELSSKLSCAFAFIDAAFGDDQEAVVFMTELSASKDLALFVSKFGCDAYDSHSGAMQVDTHKKDLLNRVQELESAAAGEHEAAGAQAVTAQPARTQATVVVEEPAASDDALEEHYKTQNFEYGYASLCRMTLPDGLYGKSVLDIGCRRGKGVFKLSDRVGEKGHVIGIDWNKAHIKEAVERSDRAWRDSGLPRNNMEFHLAYPEDLISAGIGNQTIDFAFINSVLHLTCNPNQVLAEISRVLKPGAQLTCEVALADAQRDPEVVEAARKLGNSIQAACSKEQLETWLSELGFAAPEYSHTAPIEPNTGYKFDYEVEVAPSTEDVRFVSTVATALKK